MAMECLPWWPLAPWLSPTAAWFIFFNAIVGAIAVMSWGQGGHAPSRRRLCRSASSMVLDRLRSFTIFPAHPAPGYGAGVTAPTLELDGAVSEYYYGPRGSEEAPEPPKPWPRVTWESGTAGCTSAPVATAVCTAPPSAIVPKAAAEDDAETAPEPASEGNRAKAEEQEKSMSLDEAYALAQQRCSQQSPSVPAAAAIAATQATTALSRPRKKEPAKATKRRARACGRDAEEVLNGKAELNARADLFIRQFREELKLQRLNSILSHTHGLGSHAVTPAAR